MPALNFSARSRDPESPDYGPMIGPAPGSPGYQFPAHIKQGVGRFASEALKHSPLNLSALKDMAAEILANPVMTPVNIVNAQLEQFGKAWDDLKGNRPYDAALHGTFGIIPLIGPAMDAGWERMKQGDTAGGAGAMLGVMSAVVAPEAVAKVAPIVAEGRVRLPALIRNRNPTQAAAVQAGVDAGIPVDLATATGSKFLRGAGQGLEHTPVGAIVEHIAKPKRDVALRTQAARLTDEVNPVSYTPLEAGYSIQAVAQRARDAYTATADAAYTRFREAVGTTTVDITAAQAKLRPIYLQLMRRNEIHRLEGAQGKALVSLDRVMRFPDPKKVGLADLDAALSDIKALARRDGGVVKLEVAALEQQVMAGARRSGTTAVEALVDGRTAIKSRVPIDEVLRRIKDEPVRAYEQFTSPGDKGILFLRELAKIDEALPLQTGRAWLEQQLDPVTVGGAFENTLRLSAEWGKLGAETKTLLFGGGKNVAALDKFFRLSKELNIVHNPSGTAGSLIATGATTALATGSAFVDIGSTIMALLGSGALVAIMRSPTAVRLLTQGLSKSLGPGRSATPAIARSMQAQALAGVMAARREAGLPERED